MDAVLPDAAVCAQARLARDARFDGVFFTAVRTTGIYCRPVCPVPAANERNVHYVASAAQAEAEGYRPCLRCRPELSPADGSWRRGDHVVARALRLIDDGALDAASVEELAKRLHVGDRHLRRLFADSLGTTPQQVQATRRLLFAKRLLSETALPITDVAAASGFASLRRFNDAFAKAYGMPPSALRHADDALPAGDGLRLRLAFRPPFEFDATLAFLRQRALPGIERVEADAYMRVLEPSLASHADAAAWLRVSACPTAAALQLELHGVAAHAIAPIVQRVRRMFDLDADPLVIAACLGNDPRLAPLLQRHPGLRIPGGWDGFEVAVRAVLGQQVSVRAATTLAARLVTQHGVRLPHPVADDLHSVFPSPQQLATADLTTLGLPATRRASLHAIAAALARGTLDFDAAAPLDHHVDRWMRLPGIGPWTAHYIALRGSNHPDAFPAGDLVLRKQAGNGTALTERQLAARAEHWRPWRAYAAIQLWHAAVNPEDSA